MTELKAPPHLPPLEDNVELDRAVGSMHRVADRLVADDDRKALLQGRWLGHPVHPVLTDLAIGFWTSSFVLDTVPVKRLRAASDAFVALGLVSAVPTVLTGLADWTELDRRKQRVGVVHAAANAVGVACYATSLLNRLRGRRARGIAWSTVGAGALTVGGYLGGHLAFGD